MMLHCITKSNPLWNKKQGRVFFFSFVFRGEFIEVSKMDSWRKERPQRGEFVRVCLMNVGLSCVVPAQLGVEGSKGFW